MEVVLLLANSNVFAMSHVSQMTDLGRNLPRILCENTVLSTLSIHLMILVLYYRYCVHGE